MAIWLGPPLLTGASFWVTQAATAPDGPLANRAVESIPTLLAEPPAPAAEQSPTDFNLHGLTPTIEQDCLDHAGRINHQFPELTQPVIRSPFVMTGDLSETELLTIYRRSLFPVANAVQQTLGLSSPQQPVTVMVFRTTAGFRRFAGATSGTWYMKYYGFYLKDERRLVVNLETGEGTLAHELTHVLLHADCPTLPEWFDEGIASLYEESQISPDGSKIRGINNWRTAILRQWTRPGMRLRIQDLIDRGHIRPGAESVDYALARVFCLYLQDNGLLLPLYQHFRDSGINRGTGRRALEQLIAPMTLDDLNLHLQAYVSGG